MTWDAVVCNAMAPAFFPILLFFVFPISIATEPNTFNLLLVHHQAFHVHYILCSLIDRRWSGTWPSTLKMNARQPSD